MEGAAAAARAGVADGFDRVCFCQKKRVFFLTAKDSFMAETIENRLLKRIRGAGRGSVFIPSQFTDLGGRAAIDQALSRLAASGTIRRLARGVYDYPKTHPVMGELAPTAEAVAKAIAGRDQTRLQPAGAHAANLLGLSEQVPAKVVYLTDGATRTVQVGGQTIQLRQTTPRNMAAAGRLSGLVIQALRHLGKEQVTEQHIAQLKRNLPLSQRRTLLKDLKLAPVWMHPLFRQLAEDEE
ncbi:DUF6088 family protein [Candidatus Laterigemmans baculatus]|uniref:DUF6088 family protein n=1 Tax=Candidatus Laterigemmans baculatus TaxID=2770505 RepID=UPI0028F44EA3|nr:DUF6088 family protein [Candidatus Laterigemmans baculatus]